MKMNPRKLKRVYKAYINRRENQINDANLTGHITASKMGQAFAKDKKFNEPIKDIKLEIISKNYKEVVDMAKEYGISRKVLREQILKGV
jgi:hypothetical protein